MLTEGMPPAGLTGEAAGAFVFAMAALSTKALLQLAKAFSNLRGLRSFLRAHGSNEEQARRLAVTLLLLSHMAGHHFSEQS